MNVVIALLASTVVLRRVESLRDVSTAEQEPLPANDTGDPLKGAARQTQEDTFQNLGDIEW